jgi:hypothetical protein
MEVDLFIRHKETSLIHSMKHDIREVDGSCMPLGPIRRKEATRRQETTLLSGHVHSVHRLLLHVSFPSTAVRVEVAEEKNSYYRLLSV